MAYLADFSDQTETSKEEDTPMTDDAVIELKTPEAETRDGLTALLRSGARKLIAEAVDAELARFLEAFSGKRLADGRQAVARNGYLPEREIQTSIGSVSVKAPKVRDRSGSGVQFSSQLLPPFLRRTRSVEEVLPWLYRKGVSTSDFQEALGALLGPRGEGLVGGDDQLFKEAMADRT